MSCLTIAPIRQVTSADGSQESRVGATLSPMNDPNRPSSVWTTIEAAVTCGSWGAWIAAGGLSPARRRLARAGAIALVAGAAELDQRRRSTDEGQPGPSPVKANETPTQPGWRRKLGLVMLLGTTLEVGGFIARRRLETRMIERLQRRGHVNPHAALGRRWAAVCFAILLPLQLSGRYLDLGHGIQD